MARSGSRSFVMTPDMPDPYVEHLNPNPPPEVPVNQYNIHL